jgi:hypothetical protein
MTFSCNKLLQQLLSPMSALDVERIRNNAVRETYGMLRPKPADLASIYRAYGRRIQP